MEAVVFTTLSYGLQSDYHVPKKIQLFLFHQLYIFPESHRFLFPSSLRFWKNSPLSNGSYPWQTAWSRPPGHRLFLRKFCFCGKTGFPDTFVPVALYSHNSCCGNDERIYRWTRKKEMIWAGLDSNQRCFYCNRFTVCFIRRYEYLPVGWLPGIEPGPSEPQSDVHTIILQPQLLPPDLNRHCHLKTASYLLDQRAYFMFCLSLFCLSKFLCRFCLCTYLHFFFFIDYQYLINGHFQDHR